jgi:hypothetical protein
MISVIRAAIAVVTLLTLGVLIGIFTVQPIVRAQSGCTAASFKGAYALAINGFFYDADGIQGIYTSAGLAVADGIGAISGSDTVNLDGTPTRGRQFSGTYSVNSNCTGTLSLSDAQGNSIVNMDLVIANGGKSVALVDYDANMMLNGTATPQ